jgi:hypothetical protein
LKYFFIAILFFNCAAKVPDVPICIELEPTRGYCIKTISSQEYEWNEINKIKNQTFWEAKPYMLLLPVESWIEIKTFIISVCKKSNKCDENNASWERTVNSIDQKVEEKR